MDRIDAWLILHHTPSVGAVTYRKLLGYFGSPESVLQSSGATLRQCGLLKSQALDFFAQGESAWGAAIEKDLRWLEESTSSVVTLDDERYPALLKEISDPPPLLYVRGDVDRLSFPQLAMVGSRNPDLPGKETAKDFARRLAAAGVTITSGMALGVDTEAHRGALETGSTVAVVGTGLDRVYPARNRELAHQIVEQGAIISEFPLGTEPHPANFPRRNRVISGLSLGTLVVQAAKKSGSLITARLAMEQGREVFAIPGSIHNPLARGNHQLIRQGAKLVETTDDIMEELGGMLHLLKEQLDCEESAPDQEVIEVEEGSPADRLLQQMGYEPILLEQLVSLCGLTAETVSSIIMRLEIQGAVISLPGGRVQRRG
ncbi:MAG: DNA-protecting protein DprA [Gammaproteobacteria bacterium]|jgi:DNA processing protein|nr:DNA-protecting protein DprA [Gammaproteobacteria bacterium]MBT4607673.1 DNA-protecting protein DprA [Thiotrichales bacterium]MBT3472565.1 DNA-protecting protein DprA [Gammaproteobacteria bacterium]MBT3966407.1 DNA-protecting protein DprA [Gammaproteobacteria bacterium]MBT4079829.1 DNA-protecting protein DprA [Gammaproteobacteria bacterium]